MRRDTTSSTLNLYKFLMYLFDHGEPEEFLLFIRNFNMTLAKTGALDIDAETQYLCMLVHG